MPVCEGMEASGLASIPETEVYTRIGAVAMREINLDPDIPPLPQRIWHVWGVYL